VTSRPARGRPRGTARRRGRRLRGSLRGPSRHPSICFRTGAAESDPGASAGRAPGRLGLGEDLFGGVGLPAIPAQNRLEDPGRHEVRRTGGRTHFSSAAAGLSMSRRARASGRRRRDGPEERLGRSSIPWIRSSAPVLDSSPARAARAIVGLLGRKTRTEHSRWPLSIVSPRSPRRLEDEILVLLLGPLPDV